MERSFSSHGRCNTKLKFDVIEYTHKCKCVCYFEAHKRLDQFFLGSGEGEGGGRSVLCVINYYDKSNKLTVDCNEVAGRIKDYIRRASD